MMNPELKKVDWYLTPSVIINLKLLKSWPNKEKNSKKRGKKKSKTTISHNKQTKKSSSGCPINPHKRNATSSALLTQPSKK